MTNTGWNVALVMIAGAWIVAPSAFAQDDPARPSDAPRVVVRSSLKGTGLFSRAAGVDGGPMDAIGFWRARIDPTVRLASSASALFAYEHRVRLSSVGADPGGAGVLAHEVTPWYRVTPLDWPILEGAHGAWRHEIDRAALDLRVSPSVRVVAGRQAVSWGRGVYFGAVDLFAPFSPLEVDREWRRGIDAVRADLVVSHDVAIDAVAALAPEWSDSALGARLHGYVAHTDLELVGGRRAGDIFGGVASSVDVAGAELHGEAAVFRTPEVPGSAAYDHVRLVFKGVAGGSRRLPLGKGLLVFVEYHYSGFGAATAAEAFAGLTDPGVLPRRLRGDSQIATRHAMAVLATYEQSPLTRWSTTWMQQPVDGSGVISPSVTFTFGDRLSLLVNGYWAYGATAEGGVPASEFGSTPTSAFVQLRFYR